MAVILTLASPTLATYSLTLTILNRSWVKGLFSFDGSAAPTGDHAIMEKVMSDLQQAPLQIMNDLHQVPPETMGNINVQQARPNDVQQAPPNDVQQAPQNDVEQGPPNDVERGPPNDVERGPPNDLQQPPLGIMNGLHHMPQEVTNDLEQAPVGIRPTRLSRFVRAERWWTELRDGLDYTSTSFPAAAIAIWVSVAYIFTVADTFNSLPDLPAPDGISDGPAVGSALLFLLPLAYGSSLLSPSCDSRRLMEAIRRANNSITANGHALTYRGRAGGMACWEDQWTPVIFNYARARPWTRVVMEVRTALGATDDQSGSWRYLIASLVALVLQWGTTGGAIIILWLTPTTGLGCRTLIYVLWASISTIIWILLVASSILTDLFRRRQNRYIGWLANVCWITGIIFTILNAAGIIMASMLKFANVFDNCTCNSNFLQLGSSAWDIIVVAGSDVKRQPWAGGVSLASVCALSSMIFFWFWT
jgi:hypothetical protein